LWNKSTYTSIMKQSVNMLNFRCKPITITTTAKHEVREREYGRCVRVVEP